MGLPSGSLHPLAVPSASASHRWEHRRLLKFRLQPGTFAGMSWLVAGTGLENPYSTVVGFARRAPHEAQAFSYYFYTLASRAASWVRRLQP